MKTAPFPSSAQAASEALVGALPAGEAGFLFDAPPGYYHRRNAAFDWAEGKILFGRRPSRTLRIEEAAVEGDPLGRLEEFLRWFESSGAAIAAGYFSYDLGGYCEPSAASKQAAGLMPLAYLAAYDEYYVMCGSSGRMVRRRRDEADVEVSGPGEIVGGMGGETRNGGAARVGQLGCDFTYRQYLAAVDAAKEFILSGDIYEVNLSQRFAARYEGDPREIYLKLRRFNPAPYSAYISMPDAAILSCSPELFLRVEGNRVVTRPIKGTARRAAMGTEDEAAAAALAVSEKDNAELAMIVDLERNDLGRVCRYGTVRVSEGKRVETFARVHHLVSTIEGTLREGVSFAELLSATFPGGSITGAPKIRAMQIIDALEPCRRGVYTGSVGYILPGGRAELNIAIRTVVAHRGSLHIQVGGAVTSDSDPDAEYRETLAKAEAIFHALGYADGAGQVERGGSDG